MAKGKPKLNFKQLLLTKGEYIAMGLAGFFLVILFGWGVSRWAGAKDPAMISKELTTSASTLQSKITNGEPSETDLKNAAMPPFMDRPYVHYKIPAKDFPVTTPQFDPIARPDTKRDKPFVWPLGEFQADVIKAPMKGFDIRRFRENEFQIAVVSNKKVNDKDKAKYEKLGKDLANKTRKQQQNFTGRGFMPGSGGGGGLGPPPGGGSGGGLGPPPGPGGGGLAGGQGKGGRPGMGMGPGPGMGMGMGMGFDTSAKRVDKAIEYIGLDELDKAISKDGKLPAMTVIPIRAVVVHVEVPYRKQLEEFQRALRLKSLDDARKPGVAPVYDGYEVQRRVSRIIDGQEVVIVDWPKDITKPNYDFEAKYVELINSRKLEDQLEDGMMLHFLRYDMALSLPLPRLVDELGSYAKIRLPGILDTIKKLEAANRPPVESSSFIDRLHGKTDRSDLYTPQRGQDTGAAEFFGGEGGMGSPRPGGGLAPPTGGGGTGLQPPSGGGGTGLQPPAGGGGTGGMETQTPPVEIDHLLLRFIDVDVQPGYIYQYRIRLRMLNPNYGEKMKLLVSNPTFTKDKVLYSPWTQLQGAIPIPTEEFTFAVDPAAYHKKIAEEYKDAKDRELRERLQVKDNQAVVEVAKWLEQVSIGSGTREPVGAWVVADIPTGRGEFVGRKQFVKLPLWSSLTANYVLREIAGALGGGKKDVTQPRGWLVDFSSRDILVDFEGGKVRTKTRNRDVTEDAATELLILRDDGTLEVKKSSSDESNPNRKQYVGDWESWVKKVETRKEVTADEGGFQRGPGSPGGTQ